MLLSPMEVTSVDSIMLPGPAEADSDAITIRFDAGPGIPEADTTCRPSAPGRLRERHYMLQTPSAIQLCKLVLPLLSPSVQLNLWARMADVIFLQKTKKYFDATRIVRVVDSMNDKRLTTRHCNLLCDAYPAGKRCAGRLVNVRENPRPNGRRGKGFML